VTAQPIAGAGPSGRSPINRDVTPARPGEFAPLALRAHGAPGEGLRVWPPVVLAPMAGVTNAAFRSLCRRFGAGLYVSEMITARGLVDGNAKTHQLAGFAPEEKPRSLQLYGVDPRSLGEAVAWLVGEGRVDHIDLNFGCPVRKVTRRGGGAAIPWKHELLRRLVRAAVRHAGAVPVTIKFRIGIDDRHPTFLDAARVAEDEGCAAVALHARTAAQLYDGEARWDAIAALRAAVGSIPVLGNGDVWEALDALRMMRATGCDGVVVGRGCLGRPWLFRELADVFAGREPSDPPGLREVFGIMLDHAELLCAWFGERDGMRSFRKHGSWYTKGFRGSARLRPLLMQVETIAGLRALLAEHGSDEPFPLAVLRVTRGKTAGRQRVALPQGWLDDRDDPTPPGAEAEDEISGG
jgi:nifR3 family TIM-barrel protein